MSEQILQTILDEAVGTFRGQKKLADGAMAQISDEEFFKLIDAEANSIAAIVKHLGGNLRSRWTDFLTTDGEKPDRHRDSEFVTDGDTRESLMEFWENGWRALFEAFESLTIDDLGKTVQIRSEDFMVVKAIYRALSHTGQHVGQITLLAKHFRAGEWKTLSIPKNKSEQFRQFMSKLEDKGNYLETAGNLRKRKRNKNDAGGESRFPLEILRLVAATADANTADNLRARSAVRQVGDAISFAISRKAATDDARLRDRAPNCRGAGCVRFECEPAARRHCRACRIRFL